MQHQTKKVVAFVVELYELEHYWGTDNFIKKVYNWDTYSWETIKTSRFSLKPDCFKLAHKERFNSVRKLNQALGLKNKKSYWFYKSLEDAIKGAYGDSFYSIKNRCQSVLVVRQLHDLDNNYIYYHK